MTRNWGRAAMAGLVGTAVMTVVGIWIAPLMGMPRMNPADMLAGAMGGNALLGWVAHFMIGAILAVIYAVVAPALPGAPAVRGALYSLAPWLVAGVIMMPMMGMPVFGGSGVVAMGSLIGHFVYGVVVGAIYGLPERVAATTAPLR